ncbi:MAG: hypothetical protein SOX97_03710 [Sutterella sp.]|nr:hypothetical protein [Sutterella sp.]
MAKSKKNKQSKSEVADVSPVPGVQTGLIALADGEAAAHIVVIETLSKDEADALRAFADGDERKVVEKIEAAARKGVRKLIKKALKK